MGSIVPFHITQILPVYEALLDAHSGAWIQEPTFAYETTDPWSWKRRENTRDVHHTTYRVKGEKFYRALKVNWIWEIS